MKLPDFRKHSGLNRLRRAMGAEYVEQDQDAVRWDPFDIRKIVEAMNAGTDVEVDPSVLEVVDDGTLAINGERVLIYIRDIRAGANPRAHIAHCSTLRGMIAMNKEDRYVVSKRTDGIFQLNVDYGWMGVKTEHRPLDVCKHCLIRLNWRGYRHAYGLAKNKIFEGFRLEDFFDQYSETPTTWRPRHNNETAPLNAYTPNWSGISYKLRSDVGWRCQQCGHDCQNQKDNLHVHHIDGNKANNNRDNLVALCHWCHRKQPGHGHMAKNP